jgi:hypothetical protein
VSVCGFVVPFFCLYIFLTCAFAFVLSRCDSVPCGQVLVLDLYDKKNMAKKRVTRQLKVCHLNTQRGWSAERGGGVHPIADAHEGDGRPTKRESLTPREHPLVLTGGGNESVLGWAEPCVCPPPH